MLQIFNNEDENIKFTYEQENNKKINFLDIIFINDNQSIITDWYQKPTYSGRILNFLSNHPRHQKIAMIYNMIDDKAVLLADSKFQQKNIKFASKILEQNNYPKKYITK